jgi:hypothetical protein
MRPVNKSFFMTNQVVNRVLVPILRGPLGGGLSGRLTIVEYVGRRSGRRVQLVTQYALDGETVKIRVGGSERKSWWRNFQQPGRLRLRLAGVTRDATAHVVRDGGAVSVIARLEGKRPTPWADPEPLPLKAPDRPSPVRERALEADEPDRTATVRKLKGAHT